jgi:hypothetical protein
METIISLGYIFTHYNQKGGANVCIVLGKWVCQTFIYGYIVTKYGCKLSINLPKPGYIYNLFNIFKYKWLVNAHVVNKFKVSLVYSGCEFDNSLTWQ